MLAGQPCGGATLDKAAEAGGGGGGPEFGLICPDNFPSCSVHKLWIGFLEPQVNRFSYWLHPQQGGGGGGLKYDQFLFTKCTLYSVYRYVNIS